MSLKVVLVVLTISTIIFGTNAKGVRENEFVPAATIQNPGGEVNNKCLETNSKLEEMNRHLFAVLAHMVEAEKWAKKSQDYIESTKEQFAQIQKKLRQLEESNEEQQRNISRLEQSLEEKSQALGRIQEKLGLQGESTEEQSANVSVIEPSPKPKKAKVRLWSKNCRTLKKSGNKYSGVYMIQPISDTLSVYCDMETHGGGWTVVQNRYDGSEDFDRNWTDYKNGFGDSRGEYWLGLQPIYELTAETESNELLIILVDRNDTEVFAYYDSFDIGNEEESYSLTTLGTYNGTVGDSLRYHAGAKFSTRDGKDYESFAAQTYHGGWWFKDGLFSNLNGKYSDDGIAVSSAQGINWYHFSTDDYSLLKSKMMIRSG